MGISNQVQKAKLQISTVIQNVVNVTTSFLKPDVYFGFFLVLVFISLIFKQLTGFYIVVSVFILCYFTERIVKLIYKSK